MRTALAIVTALVLSSCAGDDDEGSASTTNPTGASTAGTTAATATTEATASTSSTAGTTEGTTGTTGTTASETTAVEPGAPFFISFSTNVGQVTEGESVVFTAIVSDPDGLDDIAGGTLFTEDGKFSYGPFAAAGQEGTYSITVSWADIDQVAAIDFEDFEIERVFRAEFFDTGGHKVAQETGIKLRCEGGGACDGVCKDLQNDGVNCGACGKVCEGGCGDAACLPIFGECISVADVFSTCDEYCQSVAAQCVAGGCDGVTFKGYDGNFACSIDEVPFDYMDACDAPQTWGPGRSTIRCCCSDRT